MEQGGFSFLLSSFLCLTDVFLGPWSRVDRLSLCLCRREGETFEFLLWFHITAQEQNPVRSKLFLQNLQQTPACDFVDIYQGYLWWRGQKQEFLNPIKCSKKHGMQTSKQLARVFHYASPLSRRLGALFINKKKSWSFKVSSKRKEIRCMMLENKPQLTLLITDKDYENDFRIISVQLDQNRNPER